MLFKRGFNLIELIVVMVVIGILAGFAIPAYQKVQLRIHDNEAKTNLKLIQAAEKTYRIEARKYIDSADTTDTNALLSVDLAVGGYWEYSVPDVDNSPTSPDPPTFCAEATHVVSVSSSESWHITESGTEAVDCNCAAADCTGR